MYICIHTFLKIFPGPGGVSKVCVSWRSPGVTSGVWTELPGSRAGSHLCSRGICSATQKCFWKSTQCGCWIYEYIYTFVNGFIGQLANIQHNLLHAVGQQAPEIRRWLIYSPCPQWLYNLVADRQVIGNHQCNRGAGSMMCEFTSDLHHSSDYCSASIYSKLFLYWPNHGSSSILFLYLLSSLGTEHESVYLNSQQPHL